MQFPQVRGSNLQRQQIGLPHDFEGELNLLLIAFRQWQQRLVDSWIPVAQHLEGQYPGLVYYELPTIRSMNYLAKTFINEGMRAGIPNPQARQRTITLYLDKQTFRKALAINREDTIHILLVSRQGEVLWRADGQYNEENGVALTRVIEARTSHPDPNKIQKLEQ
jgi:hypothetical protein